MIPDRTVDEITALAQRVRAMPITELSAWAGGNPLAVLKLAEAAADRIVRRATRRGRTKS